MIQSEMPMQVGRLVIGVSISFLANGAHLLEWIASLVICFNVFDHVVVIEWERADRASEHLECRINVVVHLLLHQRGVLDVIIRRSLRNSLLVLLLRQKVLPAWTQWLFGASEGHLSWEWLVLELLNLITRMLSKYIYWC